MPENVRGKTRLVTTRREFLQLGAAAVAAAPATGLWSLHAKAAGPKSGGHMRLAVSGAASTDNLDVGQMGDTHRRLIGLACRGNLVEYMPDGTAKPELAESWESANGGKTWRFKLRQGVEFSNGKSLTPEDVIASMNQHRGEASTSAMKNQFASVTDIKADGKNTVVFSLQDGMVEFPAILSIEQFNICPSIDGVPDMSGVGAGAYVLKEFRPGITAVLERNRNSYKTGYVGSAEILGVSDVAARQAAIASGDVDIINNPDLKMLQRLSGNPAVRVESYSGRWTYWFGMRMKSAPFDNADVRTAMKYGIDREAMVKTIMYGYAKVGNDQPITPAYRHFNPNLKPKPYDPDKARFYLKKAGFAGLDLTFATSDAALPNAVDLAQMYQQQSAACGIKMTIDRKPADSYWATMDSNTVPFYQDSWGGFTTEDTMLTMSLSAGAPWNHTLWEDPEFNSLLKAVRAEEDEAKRRQMFFRLQELASEDGGAMVPIFADYVHVISSRIKNNGAFTSNLELDGNRCIERWWIDG